MSELIMKRMGVSFKFIFVYKTTERESSSVSMSSVEQCFNGPYVCSVDFDLSDKDNIIETFLVDTFLKQEKKNMLREVHAETDESAILDNELRFNRNDIRKIVNAFEIFLEEEAVFDSIPPVNPKRLATNLQLAYCDDESCGYSWYITGKFADDPLSVCYETSWCQTILVLVDRKEVRRIRVAGDSSSDSSE